MINWCARCGSEEIYIPVPREPRGGGTRAVYCEPCFDSPLYWMLGETESKGVFYTSPVTAERL